MKFKILFLIYLIENVFSIKISNQYKQGSVVGNNICKCSIPKIKSKVYNGTKVKQNDYPWVVGLYSIKKRTIICSGILLSEITVLTAAHCFDKYSKNEINVLAGYVENYKSMIDTKWGSREISKILLHPFYNQSKIAIPSINDIAIIILNEKFILGFNNSIYPACILKQKINVPKLYDFYFAGYGVMSPYFVQKNNLKGFNLIYAKGLISTVLRYDFNNCKYQDISENVFCLKNPYGSVCLGDSGGAFHVILGQKLIVVSIHSSSRLYKLPNSHLIACFKENVSFSVKISKNIDFIKKFGDPMCLINS